MLLSNINPLGIALWLLICLHVFTLIVVLTERESWKRRLVWVLLVCSVPAFGPIYYLLFRGDWKESQGAS